MEKYLGKGNNVKWLKELEKTYCKDVTTKTYKIDRQTVDKVINDMSLNKSPGKDLIIALWLKKLHFYRDRLTELYKNIYDGKETLPTWLTEAKTTLIAKNKHFNNAKNYRPIACLNWTYKIYTSCLNIFRTDHCNQNNIITPEQAAGKKGLLDCTEQLLINKAVMSEVKKKKRNLFTIWLDYKKAFDSVPHEWLEYALELIKLLKQLIKAIKHLTTQWCATLHLKGENETITSDAIKFLKHIFQGDSQSVLLFILTVNPLYFMIRNIKGYSYGIERTNDITHNFFVDDLKL